MLDSSAGVFIESNCKFTSSPTVAGATTGRRIEKGKPVAEKPGWPQQPVISIRISEAAAGPAVVGYGDDGGEVADPDGDGGFGLNE